MNPDTANLSEAHYHIRWLSSGSLDWERHQTREEAEESAKRLARKDEAYEIEQFGEDCTQCKPLLASPPILDIRKPTSNC